MKRVMSVVLAATLALSFGVVGTVFACPPGADGGAGRSGNCDPAKCKGDCDPAKCPEGCAAGCRGHRDPGAGDPAKCPGPHPGGVGHGKGQGMGGPLFYAMMGGVSYGMMTDEQRALLLQRHPEADTDGDGDGMLSEPEFEAFRVKKMEEHRPMVLKHHPEADTDQDGTLSDAEFEAFRTKRLEQFRATLLERYPEADTDGNGMLSEEETRALLGSHPAALGWGCHRGQEDGEGRSGAKSGGPCRGHHAGKDS